MPGTPTIVGSATPQVGSGANITVTTTAPIPAGAKILVYTGWFGATTFASVTDNGGVGNSYTVDSTAANGSSKMGEAFSDSGSGLASGSVVTVNYSAASTSRYAVVAYVTSAAAGTPTTRSTGTTGTTAWTSGAITVPSTSTEVGGCYSESGGATPTSTATGGNTELTDQNLSTDSAMTTVYQQGTGASIAAQGTWTASAANAAMAQQWDDSGAAQPAGTVFRREGPRFVRN